MKIKYGIIGLAIIVCIIGGVYATGISSNPTITGIITSITGSNPGDDFGAFRIDGPCGESLMIIASPGDASECVPWEHVSVSTRHRCPNWKEMCFVKDLFWDEEEAVMQLHPPKSTWINNHPFCLHLWCCLDAPAGGQLAGDQADDQHDR